jgi:hypothetical protein
VKGRLHCSGCNGRVGGFEFVSGEKQRVESALNRCTVQPFTESDDTRCCVNTICPHEDGHVNARNISRIIV